MGRKHRFKNCLENAHYLSECRAEKGTLNGYHINCGLQRAGIIVRNIDNLTASYFYWPTID